MDPFAFGSLAHFRILLVPVGAIPRITFERLATEIRSFESIRLGDIPSDAKDERVRFMPNSLSTGRILLSFPTLPPPASHLPLSLFRPSHFPLAVIGVAACSHREALPSIHAQFGESLIDIFPPGSIFPLVKTCFVYDESDEGNLNLTDDLHDFVVIPSAMGNKKLYIGTLLADLCSNVLGEFAAVAQTLESPVGNEYLNASLFPLFPSTSELPNRVGGVDYSPRSSVTLSAAPPGKRNSAFRQSILTAPAPKKRMSTIGAASSHGRLFKVLGDLFLLAGRIEDASVWYTEALQSFRTQDSTWHASVLEGMSTLAIIEAWTTGHGLHTSVSSSKEPWTDISEKLSQASGLYQRSAITEGEQNNALLSLVYTSCILRHASLFFSIWSAKGWGPLSFSTMLQAGPTPCLPSTISHEDSTRWSNLERLSSVSGISRSFVSSIIAQAHGPWLLHLAPRDRINVLEIMASVYACLGYRRKEIYILREVLGCIMDLVVCGREEDGLSRTNVPVTNGLNIQSVIAPSQAAGVGAVGIRFSESSDGNDSILRLLKYVCKVLGIDLEAVKTVDAVEGAVQSAIDDDSVQLESDADHTQMHGWPELQLGVLREAVAIAEALPDFLAVAQFSVSALKTLRHILTPADQLHLYSTSTRALSIARRRGATRSVEYWAERPVTNIAITPLSLIRVPVEKPMSALQGNVSAASPIFAGATDPFLYNPRKVVIGTSKNLVVQNELLEFTVILHNPYVFDLEFQSISLSTTGVEFTSQPSRVIVPGNHIHQINLSGRPLGTGVLTVRGCFLQAMGGAVQEFLVPVLTNDEEEVLARRRSALASETGRYKYSGLACPPWSRKETRGSLLVSSRIARRFLQCHVVPEQPLLRIRRTSITHGAVMLFDGEKSPIRITIENVSHLPIDFVRLAFDDSTIGPAQQSLAEGELSVFDTYETEYSLLHKPVLSCSKDDGIVMLPGQSHTLTIQCHGKVGCTNGTVHMSYAYAHRTDAESANIFHTRQLSYSMMVTVYQMLECHAMDVVPFPSYPAARVNGSVDDEILHVDDSGWCLFSLDIRNTYGSPFDVTLERVQEGVGSASTTATISPGSTAKLFIPLKKLSLEADHLSRPIPTLSDRQFIVSKSNLSDYEEQMQRELFWYREELFKIVSGRWRESGGTRWGELSLRKQRMTLSMLDALKLETVQVQLTLTAPSIKSQDEEFCPRPYEFICLKATVKSLSLYSNIFMMNLRLEPSEHVIYDGISQKIPVGRLEPGESREIDTTVCFLAHGYYEVSAEVRLAKGDQTELAGMGFLNVNLSQGNRESESQPKGIV
ncbi:hypothetical protein M378DRAFT_190156 [Amanita muscaria Koide BX008]|uniref:Uncharacterized protein n=1 Tax=Amanita muscaria (strain Koide BX008) TaxID=946122 RepID=A0A0C2X618_AMAMK|nr:hypothetical protein M378DRAFT_190156 [Amanita muscaria Koide BX008]